MPEISLSDDQRRIVEHPPDGGHLLVLAGPGSGKTRAIVERIHHLLSLPGQPVGAEHMLALTFTLQAAAELRDRLASRGHAGVTAGTFHHLCARLLTTHGRSIGITTPLRIADETRQRVTLMRAAGALGIIVEAKGNLSERSLLATIGKRKLSGLDSSEYPYPELHARQADIVRAVDDAYTRLLRDQGALDYDDLLAEGVRLLRADVDAAHAVRSRYRFVFLDEFHDLSPDQLALLQEIAPPIRHRDPWDDADEQAPVQVMAVADEDQSIYGFRAAHPSRILTEFGRRYHPSVRRLGVNYRSTGSIVRAASDLLDHKPGRRPLAATKVAGHPLSCIACADVRHEAATLVAQIRRANETGRYAYDDIAVLYRHHARADDVEAALLREGIPIRRIRRDRFFDRTDVQESLRYLDLVATVHDHDVEPALNWPRVLVDEPTMIQLRRLAVERGIPLGALAQQIASGEAEVSPLTRAVIAEFLSGIAEGLGPLADGPLSAIVERLLALLDRRRSPIPTAERATLRGLLDFLHAPLETALSALTNGVALGGPIALVHEGDPDTVAAAVIIEHTLSLYLGQSVTVAHVDAASRPEALTIALRRTGRTSGASPPTHPTLVPLVLRDRTYPVAVLAWRLCQMLLMRGETLDGGEFTVYDIETSSHHANSTEIVEAAAVRVAGGTPTGEWFASLVRPAGPRSITHDAGQIHGIRWRDVADASGPDGVIPAFLAFLGARTLVGHNIDDFDGRVLRRVCANLGLEPPAQGTIDTAKLARRLLPAQSHKLEELGRAFGILRGGDRQEHRALPDCELAAAVFSHLLALSRAERELDTLDEALPLVSLAILHCGDQRDEIATLALAGARGTAFGQGNRLVEAWLAHLANPDAGDRLLDTLRATETAVPADDTNWTEFAQGWRATIATYAANGGEPTLSAFLQYVRLATSIDETAAADGRVTLMTIHSAKGKEWPLVFIIGAEEGTLPDFRADTDEKLAEERRVLYVGITRGMRQVRLLWARSTHGRDRTRCRFLDGLPVDLLQPSNARVLDG